MFIEHFLILRRGSGSEFLILLIFEFLGIPSTTENFLFRFMILSFIFILGVRCQLLNFTASYKLIFVNIFIFKILWIFSHRIQRKWLCRWCIRIFRNLITLVLTMKVLKSVRQFNIRGWSYPICHRHFKFLRLFGRLV